jgi:hypothetical protein
MRSGRERNGAFQRGGYQMILSFHVDVEVEKVSGKFTGKDELATEIQEALDQANPQELDPTGEGEYEVTSWEVSQV